MLNNIEFERGDTKKSYKHMDEDVIKRNILVKYRNIDVRTNMITKEIKYSNWYMEFDKDITLRKSSNNANQDIQIIFFINRNLSWNIVDRNENVYMDKGQACIYKDDFQNTFCNYPGGKDFIFKNIQISNRYFNNVSIDYNIMKKINIYLKQPN